MKKFVKCLMLVLSVSAAGIFVQSANAQLVSSWSAPNVDDGNPISRANSWLTDVVTGAFVELDSLAGAQALAADNSRGLLYSSTGQSLSVHAVEENGELVQLGSGITITNASGGKAQPRQVIGMGFANGLIYASVVQSLGDGHRKRGLQAGFHAIDPVTARSTLLRTPAQLPTFSGLDFNSDDGLMYGVLGGGGSQSIVRFDLETFTVTPVATLPASAYAGQSIGFDGLAVGDGKVYLTHGQNSLYGDVPIVVFNLDSGLFEEGLPTPPRSAENRFYSSGATYFPALFPF